MNSDSSQNSAATVTVGDLLDKCRDLLSELEQFREYLAERNTEQTVELRPFRNSIQSELRSLERVVTQSPIRFLRGYIANITNSSPKQTLMPSEQSILSVLQIYRFILRYGQQQNAVLGLHCSIKDSIGRLHQNVAQIELVGPGKDAPWLI